MPDGKLLVTGGKNGSTTLATAIVFDPGFGPGIVVADGEHDGGAVGPHGDPAACDDPGERTGAGGRRQQRQRDAVVGGALQRGSGTWGRRRRCRAPRRGTRRRCSPDNMVLVAGGLNGTTVLSAAQLYDGSFGLGCSGNSQCASGFCVGGVCCESACNGGCGACNLPGFVGTVQTARHHDDLPRVSGRLRRGRDLQRHVGDLPDRRFAPDRRRLAGPPLVTATRPRPAPARRRPARADALKPNNTACTDDGNVCTAGQVQRRRRRPASTTASAATRRAATVCRGCGRRLRRSRSLHGDERRAVRRISSLPRRRLPWVSGNLRRQPRAAPARRPPVPANALVPTGTTCRAATACLRRGRSVHGREPGLPR